MNRIVFAISFLYTILTAIAIQAQDVPWIWVNGKDSGSQKATYGTLRVPSTHNTPGSREEAVTWVDKKGNLWLFGGDTISNGRLVYLNDLWKYTPAKNEWVWVNGTDTINQPGIYGAQGIYDPKNMPGARRSAVSWVDLSGNFWLYGGEGYGSESSGFLGDLWKYDPETNEWAWMKGSDMTYENGIFGTKGIADSNNTPGSRWQAKGWTDTTGNLWFFGGNFYGFRNDLWKYNIKTNEWTWMKGLDKTDQFGIYGTKGIPGFDNTPGARGNGITLTDSAGNLWLFGGFVANGKSQSGYTTYEDLNDLWKYNTSTNEWVWVNGTAKAQAGIFGTKNQFDAGNVIGSRNNAVGWNDPVGNFWIFGGYGHDENGSIGLLNDFWKYDPQINEWVWVKGGKTINSTAVYGIQNKIDSLNTPGARDLAVSWTDNFGNLWLYGGYGNQKTTKDYFLNDLWKYSLKPDLGRDTTINVCSSSDYVNANELYETSPYPYVKWTAEQSGNTVNPDSLLPGDYKLVVSWSNGFADTAFIHVIQTPPIVKDSPQIAFANKEFIDAEGWTNYYKDTILLLSVRKNGNDIGTIGDGHFSVKVSATKNAGSGYGTLINNALVTNSSGFWAMNRYWEIIPAKQPASQIAVRFYYNDADFYDLKGSIPGLSDYSKIQFYNLIGGNPNPDSNWAGAVSVIPVLNGQLASDSTWVYTNLGCGENRAEYKVDSFLNGGGGATLDGVVLPVILVNFTATKTGDHNVLKWNVTQDSKVSSFDIERSTNGLTFNRIAHIEPKNGIKDYFFTDLNPLNGINYYRLLIKDPDGKSLYSAIIKVNNDIPFNVLLYPNPAKETIVLNINSVLPMPAEIKVANISGQSVLLFKSNIFVGNTIKRIDISHIPPGAYIITLKTKNQQLEFKFIKL